MDGNGCILLVMHWLKLIRIQNLLIIAATQYMMRFFILEPILALNEFVPQLDHFHFFLLVLSSVCITAAGYVINDYFDMKTDLVNRPDTVIVGRKIKRRSAMILHVVLNATGVLTGIYLSWHSGILAFGLVYLAAAGFLWFYSTTYKRQFLIGNLLVAILTASVPFVIVIFEVPMLIENYREVLIARDLNFNGLIAWIGGFSYFAFVSTLIREIIKDVEDFEGDAAYGRNTLPIMLGIRNTKLVIILLILVLMASLVYVYIRYLSTGPPSIPPLLSGFWFTLMLLLPLAYLIYRLMIAGGKKDYHFCSNLTKLIMLSGLLYAVIFYIIMQEFLQ